MNNLLKQSTAATVKLGPFVDDADGKTAETGLSIAQADIRLSKNGGAFAQTNNSAGATHDEGGYYGVPLNTADTGTLGRLRVSISKSGALPVWQDFLVVPANVYDSLVAGTDLLDSETAAMANNVITAAAVAAGAIDAEAIADGAIDNGAIADGAISAGKLASNTITDAKIASGALTEAKFDTDAISARTLKADAVSEIQSGLATASAVSGVAADVDDIQTRIPDALVSGRIKADAQAISGSTTAADNVEANIGNLDAAISTRLPTASYVAPDNVAIAAIQVTTDKLETMLQTSGLNFQFTTDALENGPAGGGGGGGPSASDIADEVEQRELTLTADYDAAKSAAQAGDEMTLTSGERSSIAGAVWSLLSEGSETVLGAIRLIRAAVVGKLAGAATDTATMRDAADTKNRIVATVDEHGNRTAVTTDAS
jgi:hypothetical protein